MAGGREADSTALGGDAVAAGGHQIVERPATGRPVVVIQDGGFDHRGEEVAVAGGEEEEAVLAGQVVHELDQELIPVFQLGVGVVHFPRELFLLVGYESAPGWRKTRPVPVGTTKQVLMQRLCGGPARRGAPFVKGLGDADVDDAWKVCFGGEVAAAQERVHLLRIQPPVLHHPVPGVVVEQAVLIAGGQLTLFGKVAQGPLGRALELRAGHASHGQPGLRPRDDGVVPFRLSHFVVLLRGLVDAHPEAAAGQLVRRRQPGDSGAIDMDPGWAPSYPGIVASHAVLLNAGATGCPARRAEASPPKTRVPCSGRTSGPRRRWMKPTTGRAA